MICLILCPKKNFNEEVFYQSVKAKLEQHKQNQNQGQNQEQNQNQNQNSTGFLNRLLNGLNDVLCACSSNQVNSNENDTELDLTKPLSDKKQER